jgi:hypothetical protein
VPVSERYARSVLSVNRIDNGPGSCVGTVRAEYLVLVNLLVLFQFVMLNFLRSLP